MLNIDDFIDQGRQNMKADSDRLTAATFQHIYDAGIATLADDEVLDPVARQRFEQACGFWGKSPDDVQTDVTAAKAKLGAQATVDRSDSIYVKAATIRAQFAAAGISPLRDSEAYRENLAVQMAESEGELQMLQAAEELIAGHREPLATSMTTADGLPGAIAIHEAAHVAVGIALGCELGSVALQGHGGITTFTKGISDTIQQGAICCAGGVAVGHFYNQPMTTHLSRQDSLNILRLLGDDRDCIRSLKRAERLASCIVVAHEGIIISVAKKLEQHGRLTAADIQAELDGVDDWRNVAA